MNHFRGLFDHPLDHVFVAEAIARFQRIRNMHIKGITLVEYGGNASLGICRIAFPETAFGNNIDPAVIGHLKGKRSPATPLPMTRKSVSYSIITGFYNKDDRLRLPLAPIMMPSISTPAPARNHLSALESKASETLFSREAIFWRFFLSLEASFSFSDLSFKTSADAAFSSS